MSKAFLIRCSLVVASALALAGCTVKSTETPELAGPSEFALSFGLTANPDSISQDGGSQSVIVLKAFGPNGQPKPQTSFRLDIVVGGVPVDYGRLSVKTITTGNDGQASAIYTSPAALPAGANIDYCNSSIFDPSLPGGCIEVMATPIGTNYTNDRTQAVKIHLVPLGVIMPPALTPTPSFTFNPSSPSANSPVQFDGSASCPGQSACTPNSPQITAYEWQFSDGGSANGRLATHSFAFAQTYSATLTVTNDRGVKASTTKSITVAGGSLPTASFVYSPTPVLVRGQVHFDGSGSRAGAGHRLVSYAWNWGDGDEPVTGPGPLQQHDYTSAGTFTVLLTVTDETGQIGTNSQTIVVATGGPGAAFTMNPSPATVNQPVTFDGLTSTSTSAIARYEWNFNDGTPLESRNAPTSTIQHTFTTTGSKTIDLTVYDANGLSATVSKTLLVQP